MPSIPQYQRQNKLPQHSSARRIIRQSICYVHIQWMLRSHGFCLLIGDMQSISCLREACLCSNRGGNCSIIATMQPSSLLLFSNLSHFSFDKQDIVRLLFFYSPIGYVPSPFLRLPCYFQSIKRHQSVSNSISHDLTVNKKVVVQRKVDSFEASSQG